MEKSMDIFQELIEQLDNNKLTHFKEIVVYVISLSPLLFKFFYVEWIAYAYW